VRKIIRANWMSVKNLKARETGISSSRLYGSVSWFLVFVDLGAKISMMVKSGHNVFHLALTLIALSRVLGIFRHFNVGQVSIFFFCTRILFTFQHLLAEHKTHSGKIFSP
jgi:hypothetical protein